ncbi:MAG: lysylphosphatidylglycerol synthase transmembrane domain-containing protein [Myxococcales bacterium]
MSRWIKMALGFLVSVGFVVLSLRHQDLGSVWQQLRQADYLYLLPYVAILLVIHLVRTVRWGKLIEPLHKVSFRRLNAVSAVGFMALIVLPFRLGELARPYLIREKGKIRGTAAFASIVVERVLDGLMVAAMLVLLLLRIPGGGRQIAWVRAGGWGMFGFFGALLLFLLVAYWQKPFALRVTHATFGRLSPKLGHRLAGMLEAFIEGLRALPSWRSFATIVLMTAVYWALNGWGMKILAKGFGIQLDFLQVYTVLGVLVIGVMIPAGPGMAGTFQYFAQLGLALFLGSEASQARSAAYANVLWAAQFGQQVLLGLAYLFSKDLTADHHHVGFGELMKAEDELEEEDADPNSPADTALASGART